MQHMDRQEKWKRKDLTSMHVVHKFLNHRIQFMKLCMTTKTICYSSLILKVLTVPQLCKNSTETFNVLYYSISKGIMKHVISCDVCIWIVVT